MFSTSSTWRWVALAKASAVTNLIVNADDFGFTRGVNSGIIESHSHGIVTSTTVMVTAPHAEATPDLRRNWPDLGIGLHLNLTEGAPAADPASIRTLTDGEGQLLAEKELLRRIVTRRIDPAEVRKEAAAQATALRALGVEPTHWDAHRSVAFWPGLLGPVAVALAAAGVQSARTPRIWPIRPGSSPRSARWRRRMNHPKRWVTDANRTLGWQMMRRKFSIPDWRTSAGMVMTDADLATRWSIMLDQIPPGVCEVVCHPAHLDDELRAVSPTMFEDRAVELASLTEPGLGGRLVKREIHLRTFGHLPGASQNT